MIRNLLASSPSVVRNKWPPRRKARESRSQTTLSRDLMDLRALKIRDASGALIYGARPRRRSYHDAEAANVRLARWCQLLLVTSVKVKPARLRTQVGAAILASSIGAVRNDEIAGTNHAGDDTIPRGAAAKRLTEANAPCWPRRTRRTPRKLAPASY